VEKMIGKEAHHFKTTRYSHKPVIEIEAKDSMKQMQAQQQGITLITVPFWWDRSSQRFHFSHSFSVSLFNSFPFSQFGSHHQSSST
jgi:hypothetical protein